MGVAFYIQSDHLFLCRNNKKFDIYFKTGGASNGHGA